MRYAGRTALAAALLLMPPASFSQQIPRAEFTTLTGTHAVVPKEGSGSSKPLLLLLTFSHKGSDDLMAWKKHFKVKYETDSRIDYYELLDFEGVPPFVMKMILHGMRRSVKEPEKSHAAPFVAHEKEWKSLVNYTDSGITYVVLADPSGHVVWQTRGPATDAKAGELEEAIGHLLAQRR